MFLLISDVCFGSRDKSSYARSRSQAEVGSYSEQLGSLQARRASGTPVFFRF
jgi:hypothetical protein